MLATRDKLELLFARTRSLPESYQRRAVAALGELLEDFYRLADEIDSADLTRTGEQASRDACGPTEP